MRLAFQQTLQKDVGRRGNAEFHRFLQVAMGSASELEYHLLLARDLKYLGLQKHKDLNEQVSEVKRMLSALLTKVNDERMQALGAGM